MIFPPAAILTVTLNGALLHSYRPALLRNGHVIAPLDPYVTSVAAQMGYSGRTLIVTRGDRFAQMNVPGRPPPAAWPRTYVQLAPVLRTLGVAVTYDAAHRRLTLRTPPPLLAMPTPFNPAVPSAAPRAVFTPVPAATPRPVVTGAPSPRRTPIPVPGPTPLGRPGRPPHGDV